MPGPEEVVMRRSKLGLLLSLMLAVAFVMPGLERASAQSWPDRPVKVIVPYAAGGGTDAVARLWTEKLAQAFGQPFVIENRGGASGMIGVEAAVKSLPDGYTLLVTGNATISLQPIIRKTPYDARTQLAPVARLGDLVTGFAVHSSLGIKTMAELLDYARKNPGKIAYGSAGTGTSTHMRMEVLKLKTGVDFLHVPYRGSSDALNDLLANTVQMMNEIVTLPHVKAGKLVLLAVNHHSRHPDFPDVPTLTEVGIKDADLPIWMSMWAPVGTPPEIINRINAKITELGKTDDVQAKLRTVSLAVQVQSAAELGKHLVEELERNREIIRAANVKVE